MQETYACTSFDSQNRVAMLYNRLHNRVWIIGKTSLPYISATIFTIGPADQRTMNGAIVSARRGVSPDDVIATWKKIADNGCLFVACHGLTDERFQFRANHLLMNERLADVRSTGAAVADSQLPAESFYHIIPKVDTFKPQDLPCMDGRCRISSDLCSVCVCRKHAISRT